MTLGDSADVAAELKVSTRTLDEWAYRKSGPPFMKIGRHRRYDMDLVRKWAKAQTVAMGGGRR